MIEIAVILSGVVRHWPDFFIILLLLVANAVVGFWEEHEASNAIEALKAKLAIKARVKRDGKWINPPARELVPGDVIRMRLGDIVPADARLLDGDPVEVDQSALTGESLPTERKSGDAVFSGSIIRQGEIGAMVYATGEKTYFGKTAQLVQEAHTVSHFQKAVLKIGNYLTHIAQQDGHAIFTDAHGDFFQVVEIFDIALDAQDEFALRKFERTSANFAVASFDGLTHAAQRKVIGAQFCRVHCHLILLHEAADGRDLRNARHGSELIFQIPVLDRTQVGQVAIRRMMEYMKAQPTPVASGPSVGVTPLGNCPLILLRYSSTRLRAQ